MAKAAPLRKWLGIALLALSAWVAVPAEPVVAQGLFDRLFPPADVGPPPRRQDKPPAPPAPPPQQRRGGFLEMLFGPRLVGRPPPQQDPFYQPPPGQVSPPKPSEPPVVTVDVLPKEKNARRILILGDFVAGGLAWGLDQSFAEEPKLAVVDRSNNNSGLVRSDFYDWNAELLNVLNTEKPDIVVIALGANDRQQMRIDRERIAPHSDKWESTYVQRVKGMTETLKVFGRPFFWVSAPPMRLTSAGRDMAHLNEIYTTAVAEAGGHFIDIWNGFTSDEGNYISSGPDVDGQLRALRTGDGVNFTRAGRLKLAFYVEREIRRQTGIGAGAVDLLASTSQNSQIEIGPDGKKRLVSPIISLSDPLPGASDVLAGGPAAATTVAKEADTPQYLMVVKGESLPPVSGRADDFSWPPKPGPQAEAAPVVVPPATASAAPAKNTAAAN